VDKKVNTYMTKVRDYYRHKEGYGDKMSTDEVLKRVIKYSGDTLSLESDSSFNTGTDGLEKHRQAANELWTVESERPITSHRRIIGRFIVFGKKVLRKISRWYINPIVEAQNKFNGEITAALNEICNKLITLEGNSEMLQAEISESNQRLSDLIYQKEMEYKRQLEETEQQLKAIKKQYESDIAYLTYRLEKSEQVSKSPSEGSALASQPSAEPNLESQGEKGNAQIDYFLFENRFRGTEADIKDNLTQYLKFFSQDNVLDIGCGRGEFLELLAENNIKAKGVDVYQDFVHYCKKKGLDVEQGDGLEFLRGVEDNSLGGIFLGQVIEHLDEDYLINLIELAWKKLKPGAWFIAETPNPTMLSTFSNSFYLDLSHVKPIHPETMRFLMSYFGYKDIEILYSEKTKIPYELPLLEGDSSIRNLKDFNNGINLLNGLIFGYQDYAIAGRK
jgi:2-polyprenyl-3-methyl-5-hydroxy-6-metoxy-1,4-benzoquinol methylase